MGGSNEQLFMRIIDRDDVFFNQNFYLEIFFLGRPPAGYPVNAQITNFLDIYVLLSQKMFKVSKNDW